MELGEIQIEISIFGKRLNFSILNKEPIPVNEDRKTHTTIVTLPSFTPKDTLVKPNEFTLRHFARKPIPHRAITLIRDGVLSLKWKVSNMRADDKKSYRLQKRAIENIIRHPNDNESYTKFWGTFIDDVLIGDNGSAEIVFTGKHDKPIDLYSVNGFSLEFTKGYLANPDFPRFVQQDDFGNKIFLEDKDILYVQHCARNDSPYGLSPLEAAFNELDALTQVQRYCATQASNAMPKKALNLGEGVTEKDQKAFRKYFQNEVYGTGETAIFGGTKGACSIEIGADGDEEMFLEWQSKLITIIALSFGLDPKKFGEGSNTDRSTVAEQNDAVLREAIKPYARLIEDAVNEKIIGRLGLGADLKFEFIFEDTLEQKTAKQKLITDQWNSNGMTFSEYREALGLQKIQSEFSDMTQAEMKSALNKKYAIQTMSGNAGGFHGVGINRKEDMEKKNELQTKYE